MRIFNALVGRILIGFECTSGGIYFFVLKIFCAFSLKSFLKRNDFPSRLFRGCEAAERKEAAAGRPQPLPLILGLKIISNFLIQREDSVRRGIAAGRARTRGQRFIRRPQGKFDSEKRIKSRKKKRKNLAFLRKKGVPQGGTKEQNKNNCHDQISCLLSEIN